jgi:hypothetical protein
VVQPRLASVADARFEDFEVIDEILNFFAQTDEFLTLAADGAVNPFFQR